MSYVHVEQLTTVYHETAVARSLRDPSQKDFRYFVQAEQNLETTYVIRLFVEFEGILRVVLLDHDPRRWVAREAYNRINRAARLFSIPDPVRDAVHQAREYRNAIVHPGGVQTPPLSLRQARSVLSKFLKPLP